MREIMQRTGAEIQVGFLLNQHVMSPWIEGIYVPKIFCWFVGISRSRELRLEIRGMQSVLFRSLAPKLRLKRRGEIVQPTKEVSHRCDC